MSGMNHRRFGALGAAGYVSGRYGPKNPHEPDDNDALYGAVTGLAPPFGIGYGLGRRVALRHLDESKPKGKAAKPSES
ncbi:MAG: hypothetical protein ONA69_03120 [candidate division KSB1 bacterium]|nr:hypothetical protein [candidate division KSB1 bacterium]